MKIDQGKPLPNLPSKGAWSEFWDTHFLTYRRFLLDRLLFANVNVLSGTIVDIGGKRHKKRGKFVPPSSLQNDWFYLNIAQDTKPHFVSCAENLSLASQSVDGLICTEILEHLRNPQGCVSEMLRVLRKGGRALISVPFLYPIHADPNDFQRYTADGLLCLLNGFSKIQICSMGGYWSTIGLFLELRAAHYKRPIRSILWRLGRFLSWLDNQYLHWDCETLYTSGYFIVATR